MTDQNVEAARDDAIRKSYHAALKGLKDMYPDDFNKLRTQAAARLGYEWLPKPSAVERAREELRRILLEHPELVDEIMQDEPEIED